MLISPLKASCSALSMSHNQESSHQSSSFLIPSPLIQDKFHPRFEGSGSISSRSSGGTQLDAKQKAKRYIKKNNGNINATALARDLKLHGRTLRALSQHYKDPIGFRSGKAKTQSKRNERAKRVETWLSANAKALYEGRPKETGTSTGSKLAYYKREVHKLDASTLARMPQDLKDILFSTTPSAPSVAGSQATSSAELEQAGITTELLKKGVGLFAVKRSKALNSKSGKVSPSWLPELYVKGTGWNAWYLNHLQKAINTKAQESTKPDAKAFAADFEKALNLRPPSPVPGVEQTFFDNMLEYNQIQPAVAHSPSAAAQSYEIPLNSWSGFSYTPRTSSFQQPQSYSYPVSALGAPQSTRYESVSGFSQQPPGYVAGPNGDWYHPNDPAVMGRSQSAYGQSYIPSQGQASPPIQAMPQTIEVDLGNGNIQIKKLNANGQYVFQGWKTSTQE